MELPHKSKESLTFGLGSFVVKVEGRVVLVAGRLGAVAEVGPAVGLVGFLFWAGAAEAGRLGLVAGRGLAFVAAGFADGVAAAGFMVFQKKAKSGGTKGKTQQKVAHCKPKRQAARTRK